MLPIFSAVAERIKPNYLHIIVECGLVAAGNCIRVSNPNYIYKGQVIVGLFTDSIITDFIAIFAHFSSFCMKC